MGFEIRAGSRGDAAAIASVHVASWRAGYAGVVPDSVLYSDEFESSRRRVWADWRFNPGQRVSVCVRPEGDDEEIVGFAAYGPERERIGGFAGRGELYALYFLSEAWGEGSASALIEHTDERLRAEGFDEAVLWVLKDNPRARAFYDKHGWAPTGRGDEFVITPDLQLAETEADAPAELRLAEIEYLKELA
jgi:ribosomal protein S18 acetylase RimI-like enzyme